ATPETSPLSLHDALPIYRADQILDLLIRRQRIEEADLLLEGLETGHRLVGRLRGGGDRHLGATIGIIAELRERGHAERHRGEPRSEEHTSELQSRRDLVC